MELHGSYGWLYMSNFSLTYLIINLLFFKGLKNNKQNFLFISGFFCNSNFNIFNYNFIFYIISNITIFKFRGKIKSF